MYSTKIVDNNFSIPLRGTCDPFLTMTFKCFSSIGIWYRILKNKPSIFFFAQDLFSRPMPGHLDRCEPRIKKTQKPERQLSRLQWGLLRTEVWKSESLHVAVCRSESWAENQKPLTDSWLPKLKFPNRCWLPWQVYAAVELWENQQWPLSSFGEWTKTEGLHPVPLRVKYCWNPIWRTPSVAKGDILQIDSK